MFQALSGEYKSDFGIGYCGTGKIRYGAENCAAEVFTRSIMTRSTHSAAMLLPLPAICRIKECFDGVNIIFIS
jgi:hypothetical protein